MMKRITGIAILVLGIAAFFAFMDSYYVVEEGKQGFLTQWGRPVGKEETQAGIYWKLPFIQKYNVFDKRILEWDGNANLVSTRDKRLIYVAPFARWRIVNPTLFFQTFHDESTAITRLDDVLDGATKTTVANHDLADVVRSRQRATDEPKVRGELEENHLVEFTVGREKLETEILAIARGTATNWGCEILDVRLQRVKYEPANFAKISTRMAAERLSVAEKYRSEGKGDAERILGERDREQKRLISEAYRTSQQIQGEADAQALAIYANVFSQHKDAPEFYEYISLLDTYPKLINNGDTLVLSTDSELLGYLKHSQKKEPSNKP
jgi:membrane protease subunit HflC